MYYVYIITNKNHTTFYVGVTNNLPRRIREHRAELFDGFTKRYHLNKLIYFEEFSDVNQDIAREKVIKSWRREKKIGLIQSQNPEYKDFSVGLL